LCVFIARLGGSRVLLHPHCSVSVFYADGSALWRWYVGKVLNATDGLIVLSNEWLELADEFPELPIYYVPNAINVKPYQAIAQRNLRQLKPCVAIHVLYLGYLGEAKGTFDLIEAAGLLDGQSVPVVFALVGDDLALGARRTVERMIEEKHLQGTVRLYPPAFGAEKLAHFRAADMFVLPSHREGMPMALIEAMASALPIVATSVGGIPDMVANGVNGLLVAPGDAAQLAQALQIVAGDPGLRAAMGQANYQRAVQHYSVDRMADRLFAVYRKTARVMPVAAA
jgi:glycosyltransferase involved in cell wall biosynthesis